jgi:hypothetical protein
MKRYSGPGAALACATLVLATLFLGGAASQAAPAKAKAVKAQAVKDKAPKAAFTGLQGAKPEGLDAATTASIGKDESDESNCFTARKKLWVDGEGWIVRRVTTCR